MTARDGLFVTGGSGFVGRRLLRALGATGRRVLALDRSGRVAPSAPPGVTVVPGELSSPDSYRDALATSGLVVHLAAATGRASAADHWQTNARGTEILLEACRASGVRKFVFVSSIATTFPNRRGYPYAQSKLAAEEAVRRSGLEFLIVRPTMILGPDAPILGALEKLATLPMLVVPGNGCARVQPIHVDDVVRALCSVAAGDAAWGEICEVGGPQVLTIDELLQQLRVSRDRPAGRALHVPLWLLQVPLRGAQALGLGALVPVTAGQLSSFRFDGVAAPNAVQARLAPELRGVPAMLDRARAPAAGTPEPTLAHECRVFVRHLIGRDPDAYVEQRYMAAHLGPLPLAPASPFDRLLLAFARVHPVCTRVADAYAALFARRAALRRKLVLLLAILETSRSFHGDLDQSLGGSPVPAAVALTVAAGVAVLAAVAGTLLLLPAHVALSWLSRGTR